MARGGWFLTSSIGLVAICVGVFQIAHGRDATGLLGLGALVYALSWGFGLTTRWLRGEILLMPRRSRPN